MGNEKFDNTKYIDYTSGSIGEVISNAAKNGLFYELFIFITLLSLFFIFSSEPSERIDDRTLAKLSEGTGVLAGSIQMS